MRSQIDTLQTDASSQDVSVTEPQTVLVPTPLPGLLLNPWVIAGCASKQYGFVQGLTQGKEGSQKPDRVIRCSHIDEREGTVILQQCFLVPPLFV